MSAVLMSRNECPRCGVAPEDINSMTTEIKRLRAALHRIAFEPLGPTAASATRVLVLITELARETLKLHSLQAGHAKAAEVVAAGEA